MGFFIYYLFVIYIIIERFIKVNKYVSQLNTFF